MHIGLRYMIHAPFPQIWRVRSRVGNSILTLPSYVQVCYPWSTPLVLLLGLEYTGEAITYTSRRVSCVLWRKVNKTERLNPSFMLHLHVITPISEVLHSPVTQTIRLHTFTVR